MATLTKFTLFLRNIKPAPCHRNINDLLNKFRTHSFTSVGNNSSTTLVCFKNDDGLFKTYPYNVFQHPSIHTSVIYFNKKTTSDTKTKTEDAAKNENKDDMKTDSEDASKKLTLFQRFKAMYRDYWYVLVPVHVVTSAFWFGGFYYAAKSGIDLGAFVEKLHLSDSVVEKIKSSGHSTAGYLAISYALYKIFTPLRYTVTLGGTTISINYLKKWGYIKPIPKKDELKKLIIDKRHSLREKRLAFKDSMMGKFNQKKRLKKKR